MNNDSGLPFPFHRAALDDLKAWVKSIGRIDLVASRAALDRVGQKVKIQTNCKGLVRKFQSPRWARISDDIYAPARAAIDEIPIEGDYPPPRLQYRKMTQEYSNEIEPLAGKVEIIDDFDDEMIHANLTSNFLKFVSLLENHRALFGIVEDSPPEIARRIIDAGAMPCGWVGKFPEGHFEAFAREVVD